MSYGNLHGMLLSRRAVLALSFMVAVVTVLSAVQAARKYGVVQELGQLRQASVLARSAARLVHELQRERGLSSGFVASRVSLANWQASA